MQKWIIFTRSETFIWTYWTFVSWKSKRSLPNPSLWFTKPAQPPTVRAVQQLHGQLCKSSPTKAMMCIAYMWFVFHRELWKSSGSPPNVIDTTSPHWFTSFSSYLLNDALHFDAQLCALPCALLMPGARLADFLHDLLQIKSSEPSGA